jgi:hypothetical protein
MAVQQPKAKYFILQRDTKEEHSFRYLEFGLKAIASGTDFNLTMRRVQEEVQNLTMDLYGEKNLYCMRCSGPFKTHSASTAMTFYEDKSLEACTIILVPACGKGECVQYGEAQRHHYRDILVKAKGGQEMKIPSEIKLRVCNFCEKIQGQGTPKFKLCGGCAEMYYCSEECMSLSWETIHKYSCSSRKKANEENQIKINIHIRGVPTDYNSTSILPFPIAELFDAHTSAKHVPLFKSIGDQHCQLACEAVIKSGEVTACFFCKEPVGMGQYSYAMQTAILPGEFLCNLFLLCRKDRCTTMADAVGREERKEMQGVFKMLVHRDCMGCGRMQRHDESPFKSCGKCKTRYYCSVECQRKDWTQHKLGCIPIAEINKTD